MPPSGISPPPNPSPAMVSSNPPGTQMPTREASNDGYPIDRIQSTPDSRSGGSSSQVVDVRRTYPPIGDSNDSSASESRAAEYTASNNETPAGVDALTEAEKQKNLDAVENRKKGILGCIGKSSATSNTGTCDPCETAKCLEQLLVGNLLDFDAKQALCGAIASTEKALKRQIDSTGDALLNAATNLTSAQAILAPMTAIQGVLNKMDPGALAKCFGADALKKKINGEINKAKKVIKDAESGVHDKIAEKFNKASEGLQQFSVIPNQCANKSPASIRSVL